VKFYVDADPRLRAARRLEELRRSGVSSDLDTIERQIRERDHADSTRRDSPLVRAADAVVLDTSAHTPEEVLLTMLAAVEAARSRP